VTIIGEARPKVYSAGGNRLGTMRIALMGTRGVPARYGGFETAVEEIGQRLVERGHDVTVYCRDGGPDAPTEHLGMHLVHLSAVHSKAVETLSHTGLSTVHAMTHRRPDAAIVFNAANAPFLPLLRARGIPVATHVDGLEWKRAKWAGAGRRYYLLAERLAVKWSDALIADAPAIADYYLEKFGAKTNLIAYGAPILTGLGTDYLDSIGVASRKFHLAVARFEPENHVDLAVAGYLASDAQCPLLVVGSAPYADRYTSLVRELAGRDDEIRLIGSVWNQDDLDQLYAHALTYVHGHSVGGTNPSLLRAMGAATAVSAYDVSFNREVLGDHGRYFTDAASLAGVLNRAEADPAAAVERGRRLQEWARTRYRWDHVTDGYEDLCRRLAGKSRTRP
jgi:glycosyltransferase involved in cell wall biosynthesis